MDDNEGDLLLFSDAVKNHKVKFELQVARNGKEAIQILNKKTEQEEMPDLILLDINMPVMNGHQLLDILKADDHLKHLQVIMFTSSSSKNDILISYRKYASTYFVKPYLEEEYETMIDGLKQYWGNLARLPS